MHYMYICTTVVVAEIHWGVEIVMKTTLFDFRSSLTIFGSSNPLLAFKL